MNLLLAGSFDSAEGLLKRIGHSLRGAVRDAEFLADILQTDAAAPCSGNLGKTDQILGL